MAKIRIYARVIVEFKATIIEHAEKLKLTLNDYMIQALEAHIGRFNALQQLNVAEREIAELRKQCDLLEKDKISLTTERDTQSETRQAFHQEYTEWVKGIATQLGVPNTVEHIEQRIKELNQQVSSLETQRDEFEKQLHDETDAYNKCNERAGSLKKERDTFKAKFEEKSSALEVSEGKIRLLLGRGLWDRIVNALPWIQTQESDEV